MTKLDPVAAYDRLISVLPELEPDVEAPLRDFVGGSGDRSETLVIAGRFILAVSLLDLIRSLLRGKAARVPIAPDARQAVLQRAVNLLETFLVDGDDSVRLWMTEGVLEPLRWSGLGAANVAIWGPATIREMFNDT